MKCCIADSLRDDFNLLQALVDVLRHEDADTTLSLGRSRSIHQYPISVIWPEFICRIGGYESVLLNPNDINACICTAHEKLVGLPLLIKSTYIMWIL